MSIRPALDTDMEPIGALLASSALPVADLATSRIAFLVDDRNGTLAGTVGLERYDDVGLLRSLAVAKEIRGSGCGKALVEAMERRAIELGIDELVLLTQTAEPFFQALGYRAIARGDAPPAVQASAEFASICPASAICMAKRLAPADG